MQVFVYPEHATQTAEQAALVRKQKLEHLIEESRSAKVVSTGQGAALLIGGQVIHVIGEDPELLVEAISIALRQRRSGGLAENYTTDRPVSAAEEAYRQSMADAASFGVFGYPIRG